MNNKLRELRLELGLTLKALAEQIGTTDKNIWAYENGVAKPPIDILIEYAKYFGVSTDYLLGLEDDFGITKTDSVSLPAYSKEEQQIIEDYRTLTPALKKMIKDTLKTFTTSEEVKKRKGEN